MDSAIKILRDEHDAILQMLQALETTADRAAAGETTPLQLLTDFQEFFALFADRSHHGKEEDLLFPLLEKKGVPRRGGPIGCMLTEHDEGRAFVETMRNNAEGCANGAPAARQAWAQAAYGYASVLRNHIWKENQILFEIADRLLSSEDQATLAAQFANVEKEKIGAETRARLLQILSKLTHQTAAYAT
jgi:hemerythrin-like domain-containing protein